MRDPYKNRHLTRTKPAMRRTDAEVDAIVTRKTIIKANARIRRGRTNCKGGGIPTERISRKHQDDVRQKIRTSMLINYLDKLVDKNKGAKNSGVRVNAAKTLLNKVMADLTTNIHTGADGAPLFGAVKIIIQANEKADAE